jgi:hypothetical protein
VLEERGWAEGANARRKTSTAVQPSAAPPSPTPPLWQEPYPLTVGVPQHWAELAPPVAPVEHDDWMKHGFMLHIHP